MCKYEGFWDRDLKHGKGITTYPDQSMFVGDLKQGIKHGRGKYVWSSGDSYEGGWKNNKMEGPGIFRHMGDGPLEGNFKNNYFHMGGDNYVNPFQSRDEIDQFIQKRDEHLKFKESRHKEKLFNLQIVESCDIFSNFLAQSATNGRIPLVLSTKSLYINLESVLSMLNVTHHSIFHFIHF
jgi:hypothetical protein